MERGPGVVPRWDDLHWPDLQGQAKITFAKGASLEDPAGLFNASLEGNTRRAIDLHDGDEVDEKAFKSLVPTAAALNASSSRG